MLEVLNYDDNGDEDFYANGHNTADDLDLDRFNVRQVLRDYQDDRTHSELDLDLDLAVVIKKISFIAIIKKNMG